MPLARWRLLQDPPADGARNMAVDEAVAAAVGAGESPPTLRLYGWSRPTLSLGYLQAATAGIDLAACRDRGIPVVRRPTGGRAVLHDRELTYSLALPRRSAWGQRSVPDRFRLVAAGLVAGLRRLGVEATLGAARGGGRPAEPRGACFLLRDMPAILAGGRKLVGSAERRWDHSLLQHGSLLLGFDADLHRAVFPGWQSPERHVIWLEALLDPVPPPAALVAALAQGWEAVSGTACQPGQLTLAEARHADALMADRYASVAWTLRR